MLTAVSSLSPVRTHTYIEHRQETQSNCREIFRESVDRVAINCDYGHPQG